MKWRRRRVVFAVSIAVIAVGYFVSRYTHAPAIDRSHPWNPSTVQQSAPQRAESVAPVTTPVVAGSAVDALHSLVVKGRAAKTGYARTQFGDGWALVGACDTRNIILKRDMPGATVSSACKVMSGTLNDPYTGEAIQFTRGANTSDAVQIDHVVALSNAWQTGAQLLPPDTRKNLANDPLELLAVSGPANQQKSDGDAATWLPSNKSFRCEYVARQIAVKQKYALWVTEPEKSAMLQVLSTCPEQRLPTP